MTIGSCHTGLYWVGCYIWATKRGLGGQVYPLYCIKMQQSIYEGPVYQLHIILVQICEAIKQIFASEILN